MTIALRNATVVWDGMLADGAATLSSESGALELPVTWASRTGRPEGKTSPEELIAAAHASCFAMALSIVLGGNDTPRRRLTVTAAGTLDEVHSAPRITTVALTVRASVPGLDTAEFERDVAQAAALRSPCEASSTELTSRVTSARDHTCSHDPMSRARRQSQPDTRDADRTPTTSLHGRTGADPCRAWQASRWSSRRSRAPSR
jgi:osmotically inducible protein OsmC